MKQKIKKILAKKLGVPATYDRILDAVTEQMEFRIQVAMDVGAQGRTYRSILESIDELKMRAKLGDDARQWLSSIVKALGVDNARDALKQARALDGEVESREEKAAARDVRRAMKKHKLNALTKDALLQFRRAAPAEFAARFGR